MASNNKADGMVTHARGRTEIALERLRAEMERLRNDVLIGALDSAFRERGEKCVPSALQISLSAGNNKWFLLGEKHKNSTLPSVETFREEMISVLVSRCRSPRKVINDREALSETLRKYQKLADHAHIWFLRMRSMRKEINYLKRKAPPKIVTLPSKD